MINSHLPFLLFPTQSYFKRRNKFLQCYVI